MADSEKLTALKKAYADIILNTAKEAAARVMVSERKAQRYQRELFAAKDEALRMLLRLKQMFDAKVSEAEMTSLNQQKRIDELEAQLGEAEDIVKDLRCELRELQDELERVTTMQMQPLREERLGGDNAIRMTMLERNTLSTPMFLSSSLPDPEVDPAVATEITNLVSNVTYNGQQNKQYTENGSHKDCCFVCDPDFASIMIRHKEPELYKNGCTHRIRALEGNILGGIVSGQDGGGKHQVCNDKEEKHACLKLVSKDEIAVVVENSRDEVKIQNEPEDICVYALKSFWRKQKRATRYRKRKVSFGSFPDHNLDNVDCGEEPTSLVGKESKIEVAREDNPCSNESGIQPRLVEAAEVDVNILRPCSVQRIRSSDKMSAEEEDHKSLEGSEFLATKSVNEAASLLLVNSEPNESPHSNEADRQPILVKATEVKENSTENTRSSGMMSVEEEGLKSEVGCSESLKGSEPLASKSDDETASLLLVNSEPNESEANPHSNEDDRQTFLGKAIELNGNFLTPCSIKNSRSKDKMSMEEEDLKSVVGSERLTTSKSGKEIASVSLANTERNESEAVPVAAPVSNKLIKFTFSRKRKRKSVSSPDGKSLDDDLSRRRKDEKQDGWAEEESAKLGH